MRDVFSIGRFSVPSCRSVGVIHAAVLAARMNYGAEDARGEICFNARYVVRQETFAVSRMEHVRINFGDWE